MTTGNEQQLTHLDPSGAARMVDVSAKEPTVRAARAVGRVHVSPRVVELLRGQGVPKGDALAVARVAGIMAAKRTPDLIPLCHPLALSTVTVDLTVLDDSVEIAATVRTTDRTGVEMEALTAVTVAALTVVDMVKAVDRAAVIGEVRVTEKSGGKSGHWCRTESARGGTGHDVTLTAGAETHGEAHGHGDPSSPGGVPVRSGPGESGEPPESSGERTVIAASGAGRPTGSGPSPYRALAVTVSHRAAAGVYEDRGGPLIVGALTDMGFATEGPWVVPDGEPVATALRKAVAEGYDVVLTTGGTGISPTDRTPEMTRGLLDREIPGIAEAIRAAGGAKVATAALSRGLAGVAGGTLIVNLPGSTGGVRDGLAVLAPLLTHAVDQINGADHNGPPPAFDPHRHRAAVQDTPPGPRHTGRPS